MTFWKKIVTESVKFQIKQVHLFTGIAVHFLKF